jgi:hypothetical protein
MARKNPAINRVSMGTVQGKVDGLYSAVFFKQIESGKDV